jgi:lipoprotein LprG
VRLAGNSVQVPVIAVDGMVFAELPFTSGYQAIDPVEYGAPDPAQLLATDGGFSSMLTQATELDDQGSARNEDDPDEVLHTISATVPASVAQGIVPTAEGDFDAVFEITDDEELRQVQLTGVFYPGTRPMTYRVTFDDYGTEADITAP